MRTGLVRKNRELWVYSRIVNSPLPPPEAGRDSSLIPQWEPGGAPGSQTQECAHLLSRHTTPLEFLALKLVYTEPGAVCPSQFRGPCQPGSCCGSPPEEPGLSLSACPFLQCEGQQFALLPQFFQEPKNDVALKYDTSILKFSVTSFIPKIKIK